MNIIAMYRQHDIRPIPMRKPRTEAEKILNATLAVSRLTRIDLTSSRRHSELVHWRRVAMEIMLRHTPMTNREIGRLLGNRDHSTIIHGVRKVRSNPEKYASDIARVEALL